MIIRSSAGAASVLVCAAILGAGGAHADAPAVVGDAACAGSATTSGEVATVTDGRSFRLADGREVRLTAIETPVAAALHVGDPLDAGRAAKAALEALVLDRQVAMNPTGTDRYGRLIAHAFIGGQAAETPAQDAGMRVSVQRILLARGYALLAPAADGAACRAVLRAAEREARSAKLGLWGDPYYVLKRAEDVAEVLAERGQFAVVGGKVASVRESGGLVYVNFGRRWSEDFTVTILKRNERLFVGAGVEPRKLAGRWVEVRGWIEEHGGPAIEAARPEQIEFVEGH